MSTLARSPPVADGNPLVGLAVAVIYAILYVLQWVKSLAAWATITVPSTIVRVLSYSFTISLSFPVLATLLAGVVAVASFFVRYRYLAKYTQLKEPALPPPSPPSLTTELLPLPPSLADNNRSGQFRNYLDDFLSAIRIFGYLEKPVFHELSRHLQTRRLAAGESLELGGGDFWCVVEGKVQVFAKETEGDPQSSPNTSLFGSFNGYRLLNEVGTGGTLSSLFSILSLFTEDIELSWGITPPRSVLETPALESAIMSPMTLTDAEEEARIAHFRDRGRQNSDVSQLDGDLGRRLQSPGLPHSGSAPGMAPTASRKRSSSLSTDKGSVTEHGRSPPPADIEDASNSLPTTKSPSPVEPTSPPVLKRSQSSRAPHRDETVLPSNRTGGPKPNTSSQRKHIDHEAGINHLHGTIARATVDTTLAVIPSEAFRKLTRKFPKASGTVVQVVLERFSRVTFMTAHKFLGLTREILRSESSLNELVSYPLPRSFYTGDGMTALRAKFEQPNEAEHQRSGSMEASPTVSMKKGDYFNYVPSSPTVRAPSLPSTTPRTANTPAAKLGAFAPLEPITNVQGEGGSPDKYGTPHSAPSPDLAPKHLGPADRVALSPDTGLRHTSMFIRRVSGMRKQVAPGDLATSPADSSDKGGAYYRHPARTPGLSRMDTWRGRYGGSTIDGHEYAAETVDTPEDGEQVYELRDAVMLCIAKSIGLAQPPPPTKDTSLAPSVSAFSTPNSPMFPPNGAGSTKSPFGNVLDMMTAQNHNESVLGGMLREAVMNRGIDDDASSISMSVQESGFRDGADVKHILKDLEGKVEILHFGKGNKLVIAGERSLGIYYVIDGFLDVSIPIANPEAKSSAQAGGLPNPSALSNGPLTDASVDALPHIGDTKASHSTTSDEHLFTVKPGGIAGYLASLCGTDSYVSITAKTDCFVGFLPAHAMNKILERRPIVLLTLAKRLLSLLSPLVLHIDAALDWMQVSGGQILYEKGDVSHDFYIVINGRLRSLVEGPGGVEVLREYGQNDSIGELDVVTAVPRSDTVHAIRDSELVRIPAALFDAISTKHPSATVQFMRLIAGRVRKSMAEPSPAPGWMGAGAMSKMTDVNLKTICVLGSTRNVPVAQFAGKLKTALEDLGATASYLDQGTVMRHLGRYAFARIGKLKIAGWLADQEQHYRSVLYVVDTPPSSQWTLTCIRQADLILVVGMGDDPVLGEYEKLLLATKTTARKELILLHDERAVAPGSTRLWLRNRPWIHAHHHVELPGLVLPHKATLVVHDPAAIAAFKHLRERVETRIKQYRGLRAFARPRRPPHMNDFARIARRLCGKQIGIVFGGGGARGISHIGMLQALEEFGVPIDAVAGCSMGAFVGGLYARETDLLDTTGRTKQFAGRMGSVWRILSDVTYPFVAYTTGHEFNRGIYKAFYNTHIEDMWIPFFANSTNITHSRMEVHRAGYAWRYVRASMTLAGLLPPLSDNGNLLVDGGYMDNTPISPLRSNGIREIFVVDVGAVDDTSPRNYGDSVSGWWIFANRFNPFYQRVVLSMTEVSSRLAYVSSVKTLEDVKTDPNCLYLAMPVQEFETLGGYKQFQQVMKVGVEASREALRKWKAEGRLPSGLVDETKVHDKVQHAPNARRMSI